MDPKRYRVINVKDRAERVYNFQKNTRFALKELLKPYGCHKTKSNNLPKFLLLEGFLPVKLSSQIKFIQKWKMELLLGVKALRMRD